MADEIHQRSVEGQLSSRIASAPPGLSPTFMWRSLSGKRSGHVALPRFNLGIPDEEEFGCAGTTGRLGVAAAALALALVAAACSSDDEQFDERYRFHRGRAT